MKKYFTLLFALVGFISLVNGQTFKTFSDDFESYTTSSWLSQSSNDWTTWSGTPSTSGDDVRVTNSDAYSGSKSIYFNRGPGPEDVVLPFGGVYREGQFVYKTMMKVPTGKTAYFNFQADATVGSTWAVEMNFESNKSLTFSNLGSGTMLQTDYPQGVWFEFKVYVNLTRNEWHVFINNDYKGNFSNSENRVSFLDIYPADTNASFWVDDVSFTYAPASPNNAGIEVLTSPLQATCGDNMVRARVVNNGNNAIDSVRVYWMLDGVMQSPIFVKTTIDTNFSTTGNRLNVVLDSSLNLSKGTYKIKAWTAFPNGVADTLNFDDTLYATIKTEVRGVSIDYAYPFQGNKGSGWLAWPDTVCVGDTITYGISPPTGFKNTGLGTTWFIKSVDIKRNGIPPVDTQTIKPRTKANFRLRYIADTSEGNSLFKVDVSVSVGSGGCDTVISHYFYVSAQPHVSFTAADACTGKGVFFDNTSNGGSKNRYVWNFGDGNTSRQRSTSKPYLNPGRYTVTLKAFSASGCNAVDSQYVTIHDVPVSKFGAADVCDSNAVLFKDSSTIANGSITSYYWDFDDGDTSDIQNATHIYKKPGTYKVRLLVTSDFGCTKTSSEEVVVYKVPTAAFNGMNVCETDSVVFSNGTGYSGTDTVKFEWQLGDDSTSTARELYHFYNSPGTYNVKMLAITGNGCVDSAESTVEVYAIPAADFNASNVCLGNETVFTNGSSISTGNIESYQWNLRNGQRSTSRDTSHVYSKSGVFSVKLLVMGTGGCKDSVIKDVEVFPMPSAEFTLENACQDAEVIYNDQSTTTSDTLNYQWSFGDGNTSTEQTPGNTYTQDGNYSVELVVRTEDGCADTLEKSIEIYPLPSADFSFVHKGFGQYDFSPDNTDLLSYHWDFGDGDTSIEASPYHEYATEETFDVTLSTTDSNGCSSEKTLQVSVNTGIDENTPLTNPFKVFPNPFNKEVNISYQLQNAGSVTLEVYGLDGQKLESIVNREQSAGAYQYTFSSPEASGVYVLRMVVDGYVYHERIVKAK